MASVALFLDSTETAYRIADHLFALHPESTPAPPQRTFVADADDAHDRLLSGRNPIVGMSLDDVLSLVDSGDPRASDVTVLAGIHGGFLQLMAKREISTIDQLRERALAVDTDTGYASALFHILARAGMHRDADYTVAYAGATNLQQTPICFLIGALCLILLVNVCSPLKVRE